MAQDIQKVVNNTIADCDFIQQFNNDPDPQKVLKSRLGRESLTMAGYINALMETGGFEPFSTEKELLASEPTLPKKAAKALDTGKIWYWDGSWHDTGKSELDQAKDYADNTKIDINTLQYIYKDGNIYGNLSKKVDSFGLNSAVNIIKHTSYSCAVIPVFEGELLYVLNNVGSYLASAGFASAFFDKDPTVDLAAKKINDVRTQLTDVSTSLVYYKVQVPAGAKYLVFNIKFNALEVKWSIHKNAFSESYVNGSYQVIHVNNTEIYNPLNNKIATDLENGNTQSSDFFQKDNILNNLYLNSLGILNSTSNDWSVFSFKVIPERDYFIRVTSKQVFPFKIVYSSSETTVSSSTILGNVVLQETNIESVYRFRVIEKSVAIFLNVKIDTNGYDLNIVDSLSIQADFFDNSRVGENKRALISINNNKLIDIEARKQLSKLNAIETRFSRGKVFCFGDSITEGKEGGYVKYLRSAFNTDILNYGSSGSRSNRLVDIVTAGEGLEKRDSSISKVWEVKDYSDLSCATIMIGTNDSSLTDFGSMSDIPLASVEDYDVSNDYWNLFPNNYTANIALVIEFIKWKSPKTEIHIITPPYIYDEKNGTHRIEKLIPYLENLAKFYGVHLVYATYEAGISFKGMSNTKNIYSYDGMHFNETGNEVFGKYVAQKILSFG